MGLVGEYRQRRSAAALVGDDLILDPGLGGDYGPGAGRAALELGDHREAGPGQRLVERAILAAHVKPRLEIGSRKQVAPRVNPFAGHRDELLDHSH